MILFHVAKQNDYYKSLSTGFYGEFSIKKDGFVHCSTVENLVEVANDNLKMIQEKLIILCIETEKLKSKVKWEKRGTKGIEFPHVYGMINLDAVIKTINFLKDKNGDFYLPVELMEYKFSKNCNNYIV